VPAAGRRRPRLRAAIFGGLTAEEIAAVLHIAYLRLVDIREIQWRDRAHFLAVGARLMRRVLAEAAVLPVIARSQNPPSAFEVAFIKPSDSLSEGDCSRPFLADSS
jgi:hypothetical protein